jgi:hypothetical protein
MSKTWRCFHCDEVFRNREEAYHHFGDASPWGSDVPACIDRLRFDEKERMKELRMAHKMALERMHHEERADELTWDLEQVSKEIQRHFGKDCTTIWQAADRYKNLQFELKMLRMEKEGITEQDIAETQPERLNA